MGEGRGATFTVQFPLEMLNQFEIDGEVIAARDSNETPPAWRSINLGGLKILVVDDEADSRELLKRVLEDSAAEVVTAASARQGLVAMENHAFDILISDIGMPEVDGYEFLRRARALSSVRVIPAVALTAFARSEDKTNALLAGFVAHVTKPADPAELLATIAAVADRAGTVG